MKHWEQVKLPLFCQARPCRINVTRNTTSSPIIRCYHPSKVTLPFPHPHTCTLEHWPLQVTELALNSRSRPPIRHSWGFNKSGCTEVLLLPKRHLTAICLACRQALVFNPYMAQLPTTLSTATNGKRHWNPWQLNIKIFWAFYQWANCVTYCSSNNPAQWVPSSFIKPVQKVVKPISDKVMGRPIIEPV